ncbi:MAG: CDP-glycerol glycerophosphotransferase family protein [Prevotella sp.]|nr:CDP-glycerol glycerophosphotransferase family protein [Prevotella sp.]
MKTKLYCIATAIFQLFPIQKRKIFFLSYYGSQYGCNPKYLSMYMVEHCKDWDIVWGFTEPDRHHIDGIRKVRYLSLRYFYEQCTSQVFVTNYRMNSYYRKRKGQLYLQTWHSSLRLKMIEGDAESTLPAHYVTMAKRDSLQTDALLSGSRYSTEIFKHSFWYTGPIVPTGTPREDIMFADNPTLRGQILRKLGISEHKYVALYAPTFRKDNSLKCYNINFDRFTHVLSAKFGGEWIVLLRLHPHLHDYSQQLLQNTDLVTDATKYDDIQELLFVADVVISDYSSLIFDFVLTGRPCLLYVPDLEQYTKSDRNLYFDIEGLPFPVCRDNDELEKKIMTFDEIYYTKGIKKFNDSIGSYETGHACENVMKYIETTLANG